MMTIMDYKNCMKEVLRDINLAPTNCHMSMAITRLENALASFTVRELPVAGQGEVLNKLIQEAQDRFPIGSEIPREEILAWLGSRATHWQPVPVSNGKKRE